jgi:hypothetical protein
VRLASSFPIVAALLLSALLAACGDATSTDARFSTPEHTIATLFASYGLTGKTPDEVRAMRREGRLRLRDALGYHACFLRFNDYLDEALAGYVMGALAEDATDLRPQIVGDVARISVAGKTTVVMRKKDGAWRIDLDASVPLETRRKLEDVVRRAQKMTRRHGALPAR